MKFYLNNELVQVEVAPTITETLDRTLDTSTFVLKANSNPNPIKTMSSFRIEIENTENDILHFFVQSDNVSIFSKNPLRYKHEIICEQTTSKFHYKQVRNSSFIQPANKFKKGFFSTGEYLVDKGQNTANFLDITPATNNFNLSLHLTSKEKIARGFFRIDLQVAYQSEEEINTATWKETNTLEDIKTRSENDSITVNPLYLQYEQNGQTYSRLIASADIVGELSFNRDIEFPLLKTLAEQGANNFLITTDISSGYYKGLFKASQNFDGENELPLIVNAQISIVAETYYYSVYDVLDLLAKRYQNKTADFERELPFLLPVSGEDYDLLKNTIAPNFTFTQSSMFDCLTDIFNLFDATFYLDADNTLKIEFLNEKNKPQITPSFNGELRKVSQEKRANGLVSFYQDARVERNFPTNGGFAPVRSSELGVPQEQDHNFIVDKPIQSILTATILLKDIKLYSPYPSAGYKTIGGDYKLDISHFIYEQSIWSTLPKTATISPNVITQYNSLYFQTNGNSLNLGYVYENQIGQKRYSLFNVVRSALERNYGVITASGNEPLFDDITSSSVDWSKLRLNIKYLCSVDGRLEMQSIKNKYDGEMLISQSNGSVDLSKLGLNMLGLAISNGEPVFDGTHVITSWSNRIQKGQRYGNYVANVCSYTILSETEIVGKIQFVENYNALSSRIVVDREKRFSNISKTLTQKSEDNITHYVYFGVESQNELQGSTIFLANTKVENGILRTFDFSYPEQAISWVELSSAANVVYCSLITYGAGNNVCFEFGFDSPIIAGTKTLASQSGWFGADKYFTEIVKYADEDGFVDTMDIKFSNASTTFSQDFPQVSPSADAIDINNYYVYKQANEIFALNCELAFIPVDEQNGFVGQKFIKENYFTNKAIKQDFYLHVSNTDEKYSIFDTKSFSSDRHKVDSVSLNVIDSTHFSLNLSASELDVEYKTISVCDSNGNIYFAFNLEEATNSDTLTIYFTMSHNRLK